MIKNNEVVGGIFSSSYTDYNSLTTRNISIEQRLDFIIGHFEEPIWPRTIFTKTLGKQTTVYSREEAIARFKQSNLLDCRVNAYPDYIEYHGINRQPPNFIFIDIDQCLFIIDKEFWNAVEGTLKNIEQTLGADLLYCGAEMVFMYVSLWKLQS
jgi:hypothetical protein